MENYLPNEELWSEFQRLKEENYTLRKLLKKKDKALNEKTRYIKKLEKGWR